ncbi:Serine acetyltransferase [Methanosarcina barkeri 227]|uniref:Serine acetyltransferase n=1 Tax=Methanosarcina barkeri 227 TaxID=1434106 RepID=A0A0E3R156_METBA|nr:Serine acetyltransferase [Methanosarcina barkeri 227]
MKKNDFNYSLKNCLKDINQDLVFYGGKNLLSKVIIFFLNISFKLIFWYRISRYCYLKSKMARKALIFIKYRLYVLGGNEIDYRAKLGKEIKFAHPSGVIIGAGVVIEDKVTIFQQTTFGSHGHKDEPKSYPTIKQGAIIYSGAKVIGGITVHENAVIGANSVVLIDVPKNCQRRLRIPHFRRFEIPQFPILEKSSRIVDNAENGGMVIDTRFVFTRLEHKRNL